MLKCVIDMLNHSSFLEEGDKETRGRDTAQQRREKIRSKYYASEALQLKQRPSALHSRAALKNCRSQLDQI